MALVFKTRIDHLNAAGFPKPCGKLVLNGNDLYFVYTDWSGTAHSTARAFFRKFTVTTETLAAQVDISGPEVFGAHNPDLIRLTDGRLICGYELSFDASDPRGFLILESEDSGVTWTYRTSFPDHFRDSFFGLFTDGNNAYAISKKLPEDGAIVTLHKRVSPATWTSKQIWPIFREGGQFNLRCRPQQIAIFEGSSACIVGSRYGKYSAQEDVVAVLRTSDMVTWTEIEIERVVGDDSQRHVQVLRGIDGKLRAFWVSREPTPTKGRMAYSSDFGRSWNLIDGPAAFTAGSRVWAQREINAFALDAQDGWWISTCDATVTPTAVTNKLHTFKGVGVTSADFSFVDSSTPVSGAEPLNWQHPPAALIFSGRDALRVVASYNATLARAELWLLRENSLAPVSEYFGGGGSTTKSYLPD